MARIWGPGDKPQAVQSNADQGCCCEDLAGTLTALVTARALSVAGTHRAKATQIERLERDSLSLLREGWMGRREFIAGLGGAVAWPGVARHRPR